MKRILVLATTFPRKKGDTEPAFVYELSRRLKGVEVDVLVPHAPNASVHEQMDTLNVYRFHYFITSLQCLCYDGGIHENMKKSVLATLQAPLLVIAEFFAAWRLISLRGSDLIHAHWVLPQGLIAYVMYKLRGIPYVVTAHAGDVFVLKNPLLKKLASVILSNAAAITANSSFTKSKLEKLTKKPVEVIPMGVDLSAFGKKPSNAFRKKNKIASPYLLGVGRLAEKKGFTYLIKAVKLLVYHHPQLTCHIIGDGPQKVHLNQEIKALGLEKHVKLLGTVKNDHLSEFYANADVFVGPSIVTSSGDTEGLGVVFLEALANRTPVVASNVGGISDVITKDTGILVSQKNPKKLAFAITSLLQNKANREKLKKQGYEHVKKTFAWATVAKQFTSLFKDVFNKASDSEKT